MRNKTIKKYNKKRKIGGGNFSSNPIKESIDSLRNHLDSNLKVPTGSRRSPGKQNVPDLEDIATISPAVTLPVYLTRKERKNPANRRIKGGGNTISGSIEEGSPPDIENQKKTPLQSKFLKKQQMTPSKFFEKSPLDSSSESSSGISSFSSLNTSGSLDSGDKEVESLMKKMSLTSSKAYPNILRYTPPTKQLKRTQESINNMTDQVKKLQTDLSKIDEEEFEERKKGGLTFGGKRRKLRKRRRTRKRGGDKLYISSGDTAKRPAQQVESRRSPTPQQQMKAAKIASKKMTGPILPNVQIPHQQEPHHSGFDFSAGGKRRRTRKNRRLGGTPPAKKAQPTSISPNRDRVAVAAPQYQPGHEGPQNLMGAFNAVA